MKDKEKKEKHERRSIPIVIIKEIKQVSGLSNSGIAALTGLSHVQIYDLEKGKHSPRPTTEKKLLKLHARLVNASGYQNCYPY